MRRQISLPTSRLASTHLEGRLRDVQAAHPPSDGKRRQRLRVFCDILSQQGRQRKVMVDGLPSQRE